MAMFENYESEFRRKDGTIFYGIFSGEIIEHRGGKCILIVITDITSTQIF